MIGMFSTERTPSKTEERAVDLIAQLVEAGDTQSARGKFSEASKLYARALKMSTKLSAYSSRDILFKTVQSCIDNEEYDTALKVLTSVVKGSDEFSLNSRPIQKLMGMIHGANGDLKNQIKCYERMIKINKSDPEGYKLAASALIKAGKKKKAVKYLDLARKKIRSMDIDALIGIARLFTDIREYGKAIEILEPFAGDIHLRNEYFWMELGRAKYGSGSLDTAIEMADRARMLRDQFPEAILIQGDIFRDRGDLVMARERYKEYLAIDKTDPEIYKRLESVSGDSGALRQMVARDRYL